MSEMNDKKRDFPKLKPKIDNKIIQNLNVEKRFFLNLIFKTSKRDIRGR